MPFQPQDIIRMANCLIADFGKEAETEVNRNIADCMEAGCIVTAGIWKEVRATIAQIRANEEFG